MKHAYAQLRPTREPSGGAYSFTIKSAHAFRRDGGVWLGYVDDDDDGDGGVISTSRWWRQFGGRSAGTVVEVGGAVVEVVGVDDDFLTPMWQHSYENIICVCLRNMCARASCVCVCVNVASVLRFEYYDGSASIREPGRIIGC